MGWDWLIYIGLMLLSATINYLVSSRQKTSGVEAGTIEITTAEEGTEAYILQGSRPIKGNVLWYGDKANTAIKKKGGKK